MTSGGTDWNGKRLPSAKVDADPIGVSLTCDADMHRWERNFQYGDTCVCGLLYLLQSADGIISVTEDARGDL